MELVFLALIPIGLFVGWCLGIAGWRQAKRARREIAALRAALVQAGIPVPEPAAWEPPRPTPWAEEVAQAAAASATAPPAATATAPPAETATAPTPATATAPTPATATAPTPAEAIAAEEAVALAPAAPPPPAEPRRGLEEMLTLRWGVWLGAGAILLAGVFLVKTAVEEGWLGPGPRCVLAGLLGLALVAGAFWLRRQPQTDQPQLPWPDQAPAALAAGGVAVLFGAAYATGPLYALVPPVVDFILLAAAAVAGLALALVFGPVVAAIGIAGAYATPGLVGPTEPNLPGLFLYLLAVTAAALTVLRQVGALWLAWVSILACIGWALIGAMIATDPGGIWWPSLFLPAVAALHLGLLPDAAVATPLGRQVAWVPVAALALAGLVLVQAGADSLGPATGLLLLGPILLAKAVAVPGLAIMPWVAAVAGLLLLLTWPIPKFLPPGEPVTIDGIVQGVLPIHPWPPEALQPFLGGAVLLALAFALVGAWQERRRPDQALAFAAYPAAVPVLVLLVAYIRVRGFQPDGGWAMVALALAAGLTVWASVAARAAAALRVGAHAAGAVAALALGAAMLLADQWLTFAIALLLPALAAIADRTGLTALRPVAAAVALVVLARLLLNPLVLDYALGSLPVANGLLVAYGAPALSFAVAAAWFGRQRRDGLTGLLEGGALALTAALLMLQVRHALSGGAIDATGDLSFREASLQLTLLALLGVAARRLAARLGDRPVLSQGAELVQGAAVVFGVALILHNPMLESGTALLPYPVVNELALAYAAPALCALLAARATALGLPAWPRALGAYALLAAFAWVTLSVRHRFHQVEMSLALEEVSGAELYAYSGAWLLFGAALLALGIRSGMAALRLAALAVIGLTILKAFLVDMAELEGLWRVLSFLGLGLALIALGWVYRRFVVVPAAPVSPAAPG